MHRLARLCPISDVMASSDPLLAAFELGNSAAEQLPQAVESFVLIAGSRQGGKTTTLQRMVNFEEGEVMQSFVLHLQVTYYICKRRIESKAWVCA